MIPAMKRNLFYLTIFTALLTAGCAREVFPGGKVDPKDGGTTPYEVNHQLLIYFAAVYEFRLFAFK